MTRREQWKALRANHIRNLVKYRDHGRYWADLWDAAPSQRFLMAVACKKVSLSGEGPRAELSRSYIALKLMREAERAGMDPLIWKLTHG